MKLDLAPSQDLSGKIKVYLIAGFPTLPKMFHNGGDEPASCVGGRSKV